MEAKRHSKVSWRIGCYNEVKRAPQASAVKHGPIFSCLKAPAEQSKWNDLHMQNKECQLLLECYIVWYEVSQPPKAEVPTTCLAPVFSRFSDWRPLWSTSSSSSIWKLLLCSNCCIGSTCAPSTFVRASLGFTLCGIHLGRPPTASKDSLIIATSKAALSSLSKRALASITTKFLGPFGIHHKKASSWPSVLLYTVPGPFWPPAAALPPSSGWHAWQPALWSHAKWTANIRCSQHHDFSWNILWLPRNHYQLCTDLCGRVLWSLPSTTCNLTCGPTCVHLAQ